MHWLAGLAVDTGRLKTLFTTFMKNSSGNRSWRPDLRKTRANHKPCNRGDFGILASSIRNATLLWSLYMTWRGNQAYFQR